MTQPRWEHGSEFHWPGLDAPEPDPARDALVGRDLHRFATGRAAMAAAIRGSGAPRLWIPSYFCPEVSEALEAIVPLEVYADGPDAQAAPVCTQAQPGDAVLVVNTFAIRPRPRVSLPAGVITIEDHTHDPLSSWALGSTADYCVASLRKTMPVPDGGIAWSPTGATLPPALALDEAADGRRLASMMLKRMYLAGHPVSKQHFRTLAIEAEAALVGATAMSRVSAELWPRLPLSRWRSVRGSNAAAFREALGEVPGVRMLGEPASAQPPLSAMLAFDDPAHRTLVRAAMIERCIYPAILWDLDHTPVRRGIRAEDRQRSRTLLSVHCDARYGAADMARVAACVREAMSATRRP